jgi:hypothetical protein
MLRPVVLQSADDAGGDIALPSFDLKQDLVVFQADRAASFLTRPKPNTPFHYK